MRQRNPRFENVYTVSLIQFTLMGRRVTHYRVNGSLSGFFDSYKTEREANRIAALMNERAARLTNEGDSNEEI